MNNQITLGNSISEQLNYTLASQLDDHLVEKVTNHIRFPLNFQLSNIFLIQLYIQVHAQLCNRIKNELHNSRQVNSSFNPR